MNVSAIMCTAGRHFCVERSLKCFLDQGYTGDSLLLIYNNHEVEQQLGEFKLPLNKRVVLINNHLDYQTGQPYTSVGAIFRDALTHLPGTTDVVYHHDDDDTYLPFHISEGVKGLQKALSEGKEAYKPYHSYYRHSKGVSLAHNTMEPSIFIHYPFLKKHGYLPTAADYNDGWYLPLRDNNLILIDPQGTPTFIYHFDGQDNIYHVSGDPYNPANFSNIRGAANLHGDLVINPISSEAIKPYYSL